MIQVGSCFVYLRVCARTCIRTYEFSTTKEKHSSFLQKPPCMNKVKYSFLLIHILPLEYMSEPLPFYLHKDVESLLLLYCSTSFYKQIVVHLCSSKMWALAKLIQTNKIIWFAVKLVCVNVQHVIPKTNHHAGKHIISMRMVLLLYFSVTTKLVRQARWFSVEIPQNYDACVIIILLWECFIARRRTWHFFGIRPENVYNTCLIISVKQWREQNAFSARLCKISKTPKPVHGKTENENS